MSTASPLFLVPLRSESLAVRIGAPRAESIRIGMGPGRATAAGRDVALRDAKQPIVLLGVCGALVPGLSTGDVVVASSVQLLGSNESVEIGGANDVAKVLTASGRKVVVAPIVSSPKILHGDDNRQVAAASGAVGVDMESYWCASLLRNRPFIVVRVVFDEFGGRFISPSVVSAGIRSFRSVIKTARTLSSSFPVLSPISSLQEVGEA